MRVFGWDIRFGRKDELRRRRHHEAIDFFNAGFCMLNFADSEILNCEKMISSRLANAEYHDKNGSFKAEQIFKFINENRLQLIRRMFVDGYVIINTDTLEFSDTCGRDVSWHSDGKICFTLYDNEILQVSETFEATGKSDFCYLKDIICFLNTVTSADMNLIQNYGAMGIISPETDNSLGGNELLEDDITELQGRYGRNYGMTFGKWAIMFVPKPVKYQPISLPIAQLKLEEKRQYLLKAIYAAFGIPKELSVYFESSKYANRREAELDIYTSTITMWADMFTRIIEKIYNNIRLHKGGLERNSFWYDFVGVLALQEAMIEERERAKSELEFWRNIIATSPVGSKDAETARARIDNLLESI